jgi:predicted permease
MGNLRAQLRLVLRRLAHAPLFTAITLLTLAVGVGANTAIFSVLQSILFKPLPYHRPEELVGLWHVAPEVAPDRLTMGPSNYFVYREQSRVFQDVGLYHSGGAVTVTGAGDPERVRSLEVTDGVLPILGVSPLLGRNFTKEETSAGSAPTVILGYGYWQRKLGGDPGVLGRTLTINGKPWQVIGVLPRSFTFLDGEERGLVVPMELDRGKTFLGQFSYEGIARLRPGVTLEQASADVARMLPIVHASFPPPPGYSLELFQKAGIRPDLSPVMRDVVGDVGKVLWVLMAGIGLVLLIACANVANLLLVRAEARQHELAVRAALGASRGRIAAELLFESVLIGLLGGALGLLFAYGALELLVSLAPQGLPRLHEIGIDAPAVLFTLGVSLLAGLLLGSLPILKYAGVAPGSGLRDGGRGHSEGRERHRARNTLVVVQVALAFVLLICSGLMLRSFQALTRVNPGFARADEVQTFRLSFSKTAFPDAEPMARRAEEILRRLEAIPGVSAAGLGTSVPMDGDQWSDPLFAQDKTYAAGELPPIIRFRFVAPELLPTLGVPLIAGRLLTWNDLYRKVPVVMVSEKLARQYWGDPASALGKRVRAGSVDDWREVIAVVGDVRADGVHNPAPLTAYFPFMLGNFVNEPVFVVRNLAFAVRSERAGSESLMNDLRRAVWSVDANLPLSSVYTLDHFLRRSMARTSFTLVMLGLAGGMALLLGTVGLYGVIAYSVSKRTREIGIRMALGAKEQELSRMFVRQGLWLALAGVAVGLAIALAAVRLMSSLLFEVSSVDPLTYAAVALGLVGTAVLASYLPSRRAAAVDPMSALRSE